MFGLCYFWLILVGLGGPRLVTVFLDLSCLMFVYLGLYGLMFVYIGLSCSLLI